MDDKTKLLMQSFIKMNEEYRDQIAELKRKSSEWESITRRMFYAAKQAGVLTSFDEQWFLNEILEAQGSLKKEENPNRK